jgi:hypothetical protein
MRGHPSFWADHSGAPRRPSSTRTPLFCFTIKDKKEKFSFKDRILYSPAHPQKAYLPEEIIEVTKKKNRRRRKNKISQSPKEIVNIINTIRSEYDHLLAPPFLEKKDD